MIVFPYVHHLMLMDIEFPILFLVIQYHQILSLLLVDIYYHEWFWITCSFVTPLSKLFIIPTEEAPASRRGSLKDCHGILSSSGFLMLLSTTCTEKFQYMILCVLFYSNHQHREFTQTFSYSILILDSSIHIWVISQPSKVVSHNLFSVMTNILVIAFIISSNCFKYFLLFSLLFITFTVLEFML